MCTSGQPGVRFGALFRNTRRETGRKSCLLTIGKAFTSRPLKDQGDGLYVGTIEVPQQGWTAFFVELAFDVGGTVPFTVTTAVRASCRVFRILRGRVNGGGAQPNDPTAIATG
jgi:hypothetical protein